MASSDPMEEFLARERAALGDAAAQFQTSSADRTPALSPAPAIASPTTTTSQAAQAVTSPAASFTSPGAVFASSSPAVSAKSPPPQSQFEQEWQAKHREAIAARDEAAAAKHGEIVREARAAIDRFYEEYNEKKERAIADNRAAQEVEAQAAARGALWERTVRQIDLATKGVVAVGAEAARDTSRMRDLLQDLRRDPDAPGNKPRKQAAA
ncbi:Clathrin light chain [Coemansia javaensis]|uniref:Clathrin light chain n=1 Tax=Coemansia javaensis TaxID=2761396 RepID=A0A9W8HBJ6_9FUNG|nr:Clathrin light chain [Coemansia javaensis]